VKLNKALA